MYQSLKPLLERENFNGEIILYRDDRHKKAAMCEYLAEQMVVQNSETLCLYSTGAFGLYMAKAFPNNKVVICGHSVTAEYKAQIQALSNTEIVCGVNTNAEAQKYAAEHGYRFINQFGEPLIKEYYKIHFADILAELNGQTINAFCDCGHSCATLAGFIESGLANYEFILGVNTETERTNIHYLVGKETMFTQEKTFNYDTEQLQEAIEAAFPTFGNVFEATRSISAAISWLDKNPGKTVLVYVGDSPDFGKDTRIL